MSMFPVYEQKAWKALYGCVDADAVYSAASTYCYYKPSAASTGVFGTTQGSASQAGYLIFAAHEEAKNRLHLLYSYTASQE